MCIAVCGGPNSLPETINTVWDLAVVQTCVIRLLRNSFRYAGCQHWAEITKDLKPVYTTLTEAAARERFGEYTAKWVELHPAIVNLWTNAWTEFVPFLDYNIEIRRTTCSGHRHRIIECPLPAHDPVHQHRPQFRGPQFRKASRCTRGYAASFRIAGLGCDRPVAMPFHTAGFRNASWRSISLRPCLTWVISPSRVSCSRSVSRRG